MTLTFKLTALLCMLLMSACARLSLSKAGKPTPCIAMREGVNATFRKPRGAGLVVGIEVILDEPEKEKAQELERGPSLAKLPQSLGAKATY